MTHIHLFINNKKISRMPRLWFLHYIQLFYMDNVFCIFTGVSKSMRENWSIRIPSTLYIFFIFFPIFAKHIGFFFILKKIFIQGLWYLTEKYINMFTSHSQTTHPVLGEKIYWFTCCLTFVNLHSVFYKILLRLGSLAIGLEWKHSFKFYRNT